MFKGFEQGSQCHTFYTLLQGKNYRKMITLKEMVETKK